LDGGREKKSRKLLMTYVESCDGKSGESYWLLWSLVAVLKKKEKIKCHHQMFSVDII